MNKFLFTLILVLSCQMVSAQGASSVFDQYKTAKNVEYMKVPRPATVRAQSDIMRKLAKQVDAVEILTLDECKSSVRKGFVRKISKLTSKGYKEYSRVKEGSDLVLVLMKPEGDFTDEIVVLMNDSDDCMAVLMKGHIKTEDIGALVRVVGK